MTYLDNSRLNLIYKLLGAKIDSSQVIVNYQNVTHNYSGENVLHMREAHFITALTPEKAETMSFVAEQLSVTQSAASQTASRLEKKGYVLRTRSEEDRRVVLVSLTQKGKAFYEEHVNFDSEQFEELDEQFLHRYTEDELKLLVEYEEQMNRWFSKIVKTKESKTE